VAGMSVVMRPSKALPQVFIYRDPVDFRKSHRGLTAIVELELGQCAVEAQIKAGSSELALTGLQAQKEMVVGPPESVVGDRLQTPSSCGRKERW